MDLLGLVLLNDLMLEAVCTKASRQLASQEIKAALEVSETSSSYSASAFLLLQDHHLLEELPLNFIGGSVHQLGLSLHGRQRLLIFI